MSPSPHSTIPVVLVVVSGARAARISVRLPSVIGRSQEAKIKVRHALVSRRHCEILEFDGVPCIRDLGSSNGTFVNGSAVSEELYALRDGDLIRVGELIVRVECPRDPSVVRDASTVAASHGTTVGGDVTATPADEKDPAAVDAASSEGVPFLQYQESSEGSFIGFVAEAAPAEPVSHFSGIEGEQPPEFVGDDVPLDFGDRTAEQEQSHDDSALNQFLKRPK
ncbi:MAG TPA: FHA domain-containing protein [Pirellulaceae bacterium]